MSASRHLLIYGPPGAGKYTVARAIAEQYRVHVLDNHVAVDAALRLYDFGEPGFFPLVQTIRVAMLESAARAGRDVVSTFAYAHPLDTKTVVGLTEASTGHGADVFIAQLLPSEDEVRRRITAESRRASNKISDLDLYDVVVGEHDLRTPFPGTDLTIDNTDLPPEQVAERLAALAGFTRR